MITLTVDSGALNVDISAYHQYTQGHPFTEQWYKLLAYLSSQLPKGSKVADLGTNRGDSAIALASNPDVFVMTFDIEDRVGTPVGQKTYKDLENIDFYFGDCLKFVDYFINVPLN